MNVITGLPRSGSTLLCNILNQNPKFRASSTSILPQLCSTLIGTWSLSPDFRGHLQDPDVEARLYTSMRAFCEAWHDKQEDQTIFDKSRGWTYNLLALWSMFPNAKVICTVRDLRNVYASVEKQHRKNGLLDEAQSPQNKTIFSRADMMFGPNNLIGGPLGGIQDVLQRGLMNDSVEKHVHFVRYEDLAKNPKNTISKIYEYLDEDVFKHDFKNIKSTATDPDHLYLNKYPHKGEGKVSRSDPDEWKKFMSEDIGMMMINRFPWFFRTWYNEDVLAKLPQQPQQQQQQMSPQQQQQMQAQRQMAQQGQGQGQGQVPLPNTAGMPPPQTEMPNQGLPN